MTRKGRKKPGSSRYTFWLIILILVGLLALAWWWWTCPHAPSPRFNFMMIEREDRLLKIFNGETLKLHPKTPVRIHRLSTNICFNRGIRLVAEGFDVNALRYEKMPFHSLLTDQDLFQHYRFTVSVKHFNRQLGSVQFVVQPYAEEWREKADKIIDPLRRIDFLEKAYELMPEEGLIRKRLVDEYKNQKKYAAAVRIIEEMIAKAPDRDHLLELYDLYTAMAYREGIIRTLNRLIQVEPSNRDYRLRLAEVYEEAGELEETIKTYEKLLSDLGGAERLQLLKRLGFLYARAGRTEKAISSFLSAADADQKDSNLYYNLSTLYERIGQRKKADDYLEKAVALQKGDIENRLILAERFLNTGELSKADSYLNEILAVKGDSLPALLLKVALLERTNNIKELKDIYHRIHALAPENETILFNLALLEYDTGGLDQASELLHKYIQKRPEDKTARVLLFDLYQQQHKESLAFEEAMTLLRLDPKQESLYVFIFDYLNTREDYQKMQEIMEAGLKDNPGHLELHQYLILAYLKTGNSDKAISEIQKVLTLQPHNVQLLLQLARLHESRGQPQEALAVYKKVISISPGHEEAEEAYLRLRLETLHGDD